MKQNTQIFTTAEIGQTFIHIFTLFSWRLVIVKPDSCRIEESDVKRRAISLSISHIKPSGDRFRETFLDLVYLLLKDNISF
jgi:hypothetical protein